MSDDQPVLIKPIDKNVVNQICSGQVILTLATAVKELIENSIDATAKSIQIKLKEYGQDSVEVSDNGYGVEEKNFQALTLKHHTSKISDFSDVAGVETFGFRGEALSSLCSLSDVTIITKHKDASFGNKLQFDHNGIITENTKYARQTGTTVILEKIFNTLPVRHKEFIRNIKKEFSKFCNVLYAYGLLSTGVSITCTNHVRGRKTVVMQTKGEGLKSNITQIFGPKQTQDLLQIVKHVSEDESNKSETDIDLEGFISTCSHGCGRTSADRQFYYINSRPVDNLKISKLVNEIYHQYNPHQYPFVVLNVKIQMKYIDVNVTPDKRLIFMRNEKNLLDLIEGTLHKMFQNIPAVLTFQNVEILSSKTEISPEKNNSNESLIERLKCFRSSSYSSDVKRKDACKIKPSTPSIKSIFKAEPRLKTEQEYEPKEIAKTEESDMHTPVHNENKPYVKEIFLPKMEEETQSTNCKRRLQDESNTEDGAKKVKTETDPVNNLQITQPSNKCEINESNHIEQSIQHTNRKEIDDGLSDTDKNNRKRITLIINTTSIKKSVKRHLSKPKECDDAGVRFFSQIKPSQNESAEKELKKELHKECFKQMNIIGQFNLGFIITKLGPDLFIVDQHATDEKYNFETLQQNTKIQTQKLVVPQPLALPVEKEEMMIHYSHVIRENGFDFVVDDGEMPTRRIKLTSVPLSKNWVFGKEDIDEMLFTLENAPDGKICRPSRVRNMFASRACRKSVMIGTALNNFEMRRLIDHMGEIEQPWNCPHGRPTIRHLINLNMIQS